MLSMKIYLRKCKRVQHTHVETDNSLNSCRHATVNQKISFQWATEICNTKNLQIYSLLH